MADGNGNAAPGSDDQRSGDTGPQSHLPDNSVEYCMFLLEGQVDARRTLSNLESLRKSALELAQTLTADYIWQRDDFNLELKITDGALPATRIRTRLGPNAAVANIRPRSALSLRCHGIW